jgi:hypothetical protein
MNGRQTMGPAVVAAGMLIAGALLITNGPFAAVLAGWILLAVGLAVALEVLIVSRPAGAARRALARLDERFVND